MADYDNRPTSVQSVEVSEHRIVNGVNVKAVTPYSFDSLYGNLLPSNGGLVPGSYDAIQYTNGGPTIDVYTFYSGGLGVNLIATITITYTTSSKSQIQTVVRT